MIIENPYIANCESSTFSVLFDFFNYKKDIKLIHGLMKYPNWEPNIDILGYVDNIDEIKNNPSCYFVFDASTEGFSPFKNFFFYNLYESCRLHSISPKKIIFVSSNMKDKFNLRLYNQKNKITDSLRVFTFLSFKKMIQDLMEDTYGFDFDSPKAYAYFKSECHRQFKNRYGLSLSRVNREHRTLANYYLHRENLDTFFAISQNTLSKEEIFLTKKLYNFDDKFDEWCKILPLTVDTKDFDTNHALKINSHIHNSSLFQIVNETHVKDWQTTSLFFSEKTFRAMAHMQPFLIFGQPGCNTALENLGFKLFKEDFDYDFDSIQNVKKRYLKIIDTVREVIRQLASMSRDEQIEWRFSRREILEHNFNLVMDIEYFKKNFIELIQEL